MVGLEASLHTSVGEESCHNSMKDEKESANGASASGRRSAGLEDVLGGSMNDDFDPIALLNCPLYENKYQESFANELSFGTFQDDSLPSCRDTTDEFSPRSNTQNYSLYNVIGDNIMKTPMVSSSAMANTSSPETVDSFANDASPEPPSDEPFLGPPMSHLSIPSGRIVNSSPTVLGDPSMNGYGNYSASQQMQQSYMQNDSPQLQSQQQQHPTYLQQQTQQQHQFQQAPLSMPPQMQTTQQFNDMQTLQIMQIQQQHQTRMQGLQQTSYDNSMQQQQQQFNPSPSMQPVDHQQQMYQQQQQMQQQQQQMQQQQQQAYAPTSTSLGYSNQALPGSVRISPSGRPYPLQGSASMSQLSQMRNVLQNQQTLPFSQGLEQDYMNTSAANNNSLSHSLHGESYARVPAAPQLQRAAVNQSLSQSLHDPTSVRRSAAFQVAPNLQQPGIVVPVTNPTAPGGPHITEAMSQLCDSMRRSAMSRSFVKQLSNRSLSSGQPTGRSIGRTNSLHSQNSSRSLMDGEASGRPVPVRRTSSTAKYHLQHPMRGIHRHDSQQSLGRSNHSCKSFD